MYEIENGSISAPRAVIEGEFGRDILFTVKNIDAIPTDIIIKGQYKFKGEWLELGECSKLLRPWKEYQVMFRHSGINETSCKFIIGVCMAEQFFINYSVKTNWLPHMQKKAPEFYFNAK